MGVFTLQTANVSDIAMCATSVSLVIQESCFQKEKKEI